MRRSITRSWVILHRREGRQIVYVYEFLRKKEIATKVRQGWEVF